MYVFKTDTGFGNLLIRLTSMEDDCTLLHDSVYDYEVSNCVVIKGFTRVPYDGEHPRTSIYINPYTMRHVHPKMRDIIEPTPYMRRLIQEHVHILDDVCCGVSIRRGSYSEDSRQFKDARADAPHFYHCSDGALRTFRDIIRQAPGKVFLTSDSQSTIASLIDEFGDKIKTIDTKFMVGAAQDIDGDVDYTDYHSIYLLFFLLSMCPKLFITGGNTDFVGFSTFAYTAAVYGNVPFHMVFND